MKSPALFVPIYQPVNHRLGTSLTWVDSSYPHEAIARRFSTNAKVSQQLPLFPYGNRLESGQ